MAADGGGAAPPLREILFSQARRFDFFQAVALLERLEDGAPSVGASADPAREALRLAGSVRLSSAAAPVESLEAKRGERPTLTVNFMGVGPLPLPFSELVLRRARKGDTALKDLLDIFNHRLLSLAYRIRRKHTVGLGVRAPAEDDAYRLLRAVVGLGHPELGARLGPVSDGTLVTHAGLLGREQRSMAGLSAMLRAHFDVPVAGVPLTGAFHRLEPGDVTALGSSGRCRLLGRDAVLGARFWDQESTFDVRVGPLGRADYLRLLPGGDRLAPLRALTRFYAGPGLDFRIRVQLDPARAGRASTPPAPPMTLGERPLLGYTAWAGRPWGKREITLPGAA
jgi:type VI secretion system protein ImpH